MYSTMGQAEVMTKLLFRHADHCSFSCFDHTPVGHIYTSTFYLTGVQVVGDVSLALPPAGHRSVQVTLDYCDNGEKSGPHKNLSSYQWFPAASNKYGRHI